jgi:hypothetical protein
MAGARLISEEGCGEWEQVVSSVKGKQEFNTYKQVKKRKQHM